MLFSFRKPSRLVDFSDPSLHPNVKLTEEEEDFLSKTSMFEDFVVSFTDQCLTLIENTSREQVNPKHKLLGELIELRRFAVQFECFVLLCYIVCFSYFKKESFCFVSTDLALEKNLLIKRNFSK